MPGPAVPPDLRARARSSGSRVARRVLDQPLRRLGVVGTVALLVGTAAFGGLREQTQDGPERLVAGEPVEVAPFELTVHRVVWTTDLPGQKLTDGHRWVAVVATVRNTSDRGVYPSVLHAALTVTGVEGLGPLSVVAVLADGSGLSPVPPGLTHEVAFLYQQDEAAAPPTSATIDLQQHTWRAGSLDATPAWWDPTTVVSGVVDAREAVSDEDADA